MKFLQTFGRLAAVSAMACGEPRPAPASPPVPPVPPVPKVRLAVIPAENDAFPKAARAVSNWLSVAKVNGTDETRVSKVSLEVVQLSVECVEPTSTCYEAVGRSLAANRILFARVEAGETKRQLKVTVTLYDVDARTATRSAEKLFATEDEAMTGVASLVGEVAR